MRGVCGQWIKRAAAVAIAALLAGCVAGCGCSRNSGEEADVYESPYDWESFSLVDGRYEYSIDGVKVSRLGVDVSEHQGEIDWDAVADDGIEFAFIRIGNRGYSKGAISLDDEFPTNFRRAKRAGLDVGVYFFSQAVSPEEAREEARFVINSLDGSRLDLPVVYDLEKVSAAEGRANGLTADERTANAKAFCEAIEEAGYEAMVYGNSGEVARYHMDELDGFQLWVAAYESAPVVTHDYVYWQFTHTGRVVGIDGNADISIDLTRAYAQITGQG